MPGEGAERRFCCIGTTYLSPRCDIWERRLVLNMRQARLAAGLVVALAILAAGLVAWKQDRDRDARCDRAFSALEAAVKANARGEGAPAPLGLQTSVQDCMDAGWRLGG